MLLPFQISSSSHLSSLLCTQHWLFSLSLRGIPFSVRILLLPLKSFHFPLKCCRPGEAEWDGDVLEGSSSWGGTGVALSAKAPAPTPMLLPLCLQHLHSADGKKLTSPISAYSVIAAKPGAPATAGECHLHSLLYYCCNHAGLQLPLITGSVRASRALS